MQLARNQTQTSGLLVLSFGCSTCLSKLTMGLDELLFSLSFLLACVKAFPLACDRRPVLQEVTGLWVRHLCSSTASATASLRDLRQGI